MKTNYNQIFKITLVILSIMLMNRMFGQTPNWSWVKSSTTVNVGNANIPKGLQSDSLGNVYLLGDLQSSDITFGGTTLIKQNSITDIFLVKYNNSGTVLWAKSFACNLTDTSQSVTSKSISIDASNNIYVTGSYQATSITFGSILLSSDSPTEKPFLVKFDSNGNPIWAKQGTVDTTIDNISRTNGANASAIDQLGNVYIAGEFLNNVSFDSTTLLNEGNTQRYDSFISKYSPDGTLLWARKVSAGDGDERISSLATDANGNLFACGSLSFLTSSICSIGNINLDITLSSQNILPTNADFFIAKFNSNGDAVWAKRGGGDIADYASSIKIDGLGNVFCVGYTGTDHNLDTVTFGSTYLYSDGSSEYSSAGFLLKCDNDGNFISFNSPDFNVASIAIDNQNSVYIISSSRIQKYLSNGTVEWAKDFDVEFNLNSEDGGYITLDRGKNVFATRWFANYSGSFDGLTLTSATTSGVGTDVFIGKLGDNQLAINISTKKDIALFPNPTTDFLQVNSKINLLGKKYFITDSLGRVVLKGIIKNEINVSTLSKGLYVINVQDGFTSKFIKK